MAVAIVALVVALGGTATAAFGPFKGDKIIKKGSLSGNRLKQHTITGKQIALGKLGQVPSAATAANALALGGQPPTNYALGSRLLETGVRRLTAATGPGNSTTLLRAGPFTVTGMCTDGGGGSFSAAVSISSTENNSVLDDTLQPANTPLAVDTATSTTLQGNDDELHAQAPSGAGLNLQFSTTVHGISDCTFDLNGVLS